MPKLQVQRSAEDDALRKAALIRLSSHPVRLGECSCVFVRIVPLYDFPPGINQFCLPENRRDRLLDLAALADTDDLLAAYVTQTLGFADDPNDRIENFISAYRGRIAGLMRVLPLPTDGRWKTTTNPTGTIQQPPLAFRFAR